MITYDDLWYPLEAGLKSYVGVPVVRAESEGDIPAYPFISVKQTTPFINMGQPVIINESAGQTIQQVTECVFSFTVNASTLESATDTANKARLYFLGKGVIELSDSSITIVEVFNATNRDVFLTDDYERRVGFDVRLRVLDVETYEIETIDTVILNKERS